MNHSMLILYYYHVILPVMFISLYLHSIYSTNGLLLWYILISDARQHRQVRMTPPHLFYSAVTMLYETLTCVIYICVFNSPRLHVYTNVKLTPIFTLCIFLQFYAWVIYTYINKLYLLIFHGCLTFSSPKIIIMRCYGPLCCSRNYCY